MCTARLLTLTYKLFNHHLSAFHRASPASIDTPAQSAAESTYTATGAAALCGVLVIVGVGLVKRCVCVKRRCSVLTSAERVFIDCTSLR